MSGRPTSPAALRFDDWLPSDTQFAEGQADLALISSDGIRIPVQRLYIASASSVFRDMISCSSESEDDEINLTDSDFEKASNIFRLLDVVYGKPIPFFQPNHQLYFGLRKGQALKELITGLVPVIQLAEKYDCAAAVQHLRLAFRALSNVADSWYSFRSAVQINELECATEAIRRGAMLPLLPPSHKDDIHLEKIVLPDTPKPAGFSLRQCRRMPVDILWALDRACRKDNWMETEGPPANGIEHSREECWNNVASRFAKLMKRINTVGFTEEV